MSKRFIFRKNGWIVFVLIFLPVSAFAQKYKSIKSYVRFYSEAPVENIEAVSVEGKSIIDISDKKVVFSIPIRSFYFKKSLMQEHFNENYMESEKFPESTFKGEIIDLDKSKLTNQKVKVKGVMNIHGVRRDVTIEGDILPGDNYIKVKSKFNVVLADYDIKIPKIVTYNISEIIEVTVIFDYAKM